MRQSFWIWKDILARPVYRAAKQRHDITRGTRDGHAIEAESFRRALLFGDGGEYVALRHSLGVRDRVVDRDRDATVGIRCESKRRVRQRKGYPAVARAEPIEHVGPH